MKRRDMSNYKEVYEQLLKKKEKSLTEYQKFVQIESKKERYSKLKGSERLKVIALLWKKRRLGNRMDT